MSCEIFTYLKGTTEFPAILLQTTTKIETNKIAMKIMAKIVVISNTSPYGFYE